MEDAFAVYVVYGTEQLVHINLYFAVIQVLIAHQALVKILLHQLKDEGEFA
jgi:hypothetical protein